MTASDLTLVILAGIIFIVVSLYIYTYSILSRSVLIYGPFAFVVLFLSLYGVFVLPLDISSTNYLMCLDEHPNNTELCLKPKNFVEPDVLVKIWRSIYWTLMLMAWVILPFCKGMSSSGHFDVYRRFRYALIYNSIFYCIYLVLFICLLIYMCSQRHHTPITFSSIHAVLAATSNTCGILLLILVMGYGLIDLPRHLYKLSLYDYQYEKTLFKIALTSDSIYTYRHKLDQNLRQLASAQQRVQDDLVKRTYLATILSKLPLELRYAVETGKIRLAEEDSDFYDANSLKIQFLEFFGISPSRSGQLADYTKLGVLASLHTNVKFNVKTISSGHILLSRLIDEAIFYEDLFQATSSDGRTIAFSQHRKYSLLTLWWLPYIERYWFLYMRTWFFRLASLLTLVASVVVVLSEMMLSTTKPTLSLLALLMRTMLRPGMNFMVAQAFSFLVLSYMAICTYRTVFQLKLFDLIRIMNNHQTHIYSLLHSATIVGFFFAPICLNYLSMIHFDKGTLFKLNHTRETSFSQIEGRFELLPFISKYFNLYYPMIIIVVCIFALLSLITRFLGSFGFGRFFHGSAESEDHTSEGRIILEREKHNRAVEEQLEDASRVPLDTNPLLNFEPSLS